MESVRMSQREFDELPVHQKNLPVMAAVGKRWKRKMKDCWLMGEYTEDPRRNRSVVRVKWSRIELGERNR